MKALIILNLIISYIGIGFIFAYTQEMFGSMLNFERKKHKKPTEPHSTLEVRFKLVLLWPYILICYLKYGLYEKTKNLKNERKD